eukprot:TRINITY_DN39950_c0_g1_i1.p1 TRINITY_DN39950_c0_g1~~TRINITY_DN39950_c0_g1_i1.p1  ORF type:complete len:174 (+),score=38.51 TRINITY_DN39950_c0_g1_i1:90-611(+)
MQIYVKTLVGRHFALDVTPQDTPAAVLAKLRDAAGPQIFGPGDQGLLIFAGKQLKDMDKTLSDYNVSRESTLHFIVRKNVLRFSGQEFAPSQLQQPLSETGITAESAVELLHVPRLPTEVLGSSSASSGGLPIYVSAPALGKADPVCVELPPDATLGDLVLAAATQLELPVPQ